jgi:hypothetical protein
VGCVFLSYADVRSADKARIALHGRQFGGACVVASFVSQADWEAGKL